MIYETDSRRIKMATYDNKLLDGEHLTYYTQKVKAALTDKQDLIDASNKLDYSLLDNTPTIPDELADLTSDATHRVVTDTQISEWNAKQVALVFNTAYDASTNKAATMTDINEAISSLTGFHFEIVQTLPATGETNVIYLVLKSSGETGNVYTEYAWINNAWEKLGDTQISIETLSNSDIDAIWDAAV